MGVVENLEAGPQILLRGSEEPVCGGWQLGRQTQTPSLQTKAKASTEPRVRKRSVRSPSSSRKGEARPAETGTTPNDPAGH